MNKIKYYLPALLFIITGISLKAQDKSIFWEITGNGLEKPSYLYGTIHMIAQSDFSIPEVLEEKFKSAEQIVLELDMDDPGMITKMQQHMFMQGTTLKELLDSNDYNFLINYFLDSLNLPLEQLGSIKPIFLTQFIIPEIINEPVASYELSFIQMAKKDSINLIGLETVEEQMGVLDKIPFKRQAELVVETIEDFKESRVLYSQMVAAYKNEELNEFYRLMFEMSKELEEFEQILLIDRNEKWAPRIEDLINEKSCFIAVGALHLEGEKGLVEMLKSKGYNLIPLR